MHVEEADRHHLYTTIDEVLGPRASSTLMSLLPPVGWADVATKADVSALESRMQGEHAQIRGDFAQLRGEFSELRGEFSELRGEFSELRGEFSELRGEFKGDLAALETRLTDAMRTQLFAMLAAMLTTSTLAVAASAVFA